MFKKRKFNKRRQVADGNDGSNKRAKNKNSDSDNSEKDSEEDSLNLANFKKQKIKEKNGDKCLMASTIDERTKKQKVWEQKNMAIRLNGEGFKAKRELDQSLQHAEDLDNLDKAQLELNQDAYDRELRRIEISNGIKDGTLDPSTYRGQHGYASYFDRTEDDLKKKQFNGTLGPTRKENYVKESARMDYNPELCKDYFETGHCAFGDTCIFIHDRTDYASGHVLEKDWNDQQRKLHKKLMGKKYGDSNSDSEEDAVSQKFDDIDDEGLPLKWKICSNFFKEPIMTECGHYFWESCALKNYRTDKSCFSCGKHTHGIFHEAVKITKKLGKMTKEELEDYRRNYSYDAANESIHEDDCQKAESTACWGHNHKKTKKKELTAQEEQEEVMNEFIERQKAIRENNYKPSGGGYIIP